ncbi:hypothetical protein FQN60_012891, partial [Etheostoma spectabile]
MGLGRESIGRSL